MEMKLSGYSDYALRVLMHAALRTPALSTVDEVADAFGISRNHLTKVVHGLALQGFLSTRRGIGGGFTLARPPAEICVGDVIRLTETDETVIDCINRRNQPCTIFPICRLKGVLAEAAAAFFAVLDRYSLEDLVKRKAAMKDLLGI
jgi:Rrf2 family nitric oxide-sensitive transcriptional repressor